MMNKTIGFIGAGNMAKAMISGLVSSEIVLPENIFVYNIHRSKTEQLHNNYNITIADDLAALVRQMDIIIIAVKPHIVSSVLMDINTYLKNETILISIAAGITIATIEKYVGQDKKVIRVMPNTPAFVQEAMSSCTPNKHVTQLELDGVMLLLNSFGQSAIVPETMVHAVVGVSGSAPAYVFMFIEAMADAAVLAGMPRAQAYHFAAQAVIGSAKMVLETGEHPGVLKDNVCSPGGTTIEAVKMLESTGFRASVITSIGACIEKSMRLSLEEH